MSLHEIASGILAAARTAAAQHENPEDCSQAFDNALNDELLNIEDERRDQVAAIINRRLACPAI